MKDLSFVSVAAINAACYSIGMNSLRIDNGTPDLAVFDPRGLAVCAVAYYRSVAGQPVQPQITRRVFDPLGREVERFDPRLWAEQRGPNRTSLRALSSTELLNVSVDSGWTLLLFGPAGQWLQRWNSRSSQQRDYDVQLRPVAVTEQLEDETPRAVERFQYGGPGGSTRNQCGKLIRHDDPSTTRHMLDYDLRGQPLLESSHFLTSLDLLHWPLEIDARNALLEPAPGLDSRWTYDALGEVATQTDAMLNRRRFSRTCAGQLRAVSLQRQGAGEVTLVSDLGYSAGGLVEQETAGNGVITRAEFSPDDARLLRLSAGLPNQPLLQNLLYTYDPVGNPLQIDDQAKAITHFKNQRIDPVSTYIYDSLYRLTRATGREVYRAANDPNALVNYREEYDYDASGNLLELRHLGAQPFTRRWAVDAASNRRVIAYDGDPAPDFSREFDGNGNQLHLLRGQAMGWDARNQLSQVSPVTREDGPDDCELYRYGGGGKRLRKVRCALASHRSLIADVRYLPGLEIHRAANGAERHVLEIEAGRNTVRLRHWVGTPPTGVDNTHLSYSVSDHLRSSQLELDEEGAVISEEGYLPFGGRAWWVAHHAAKASYKTTGYSGKECDVTGLSYYGYRYYAPWQHGWLNPDPAGEVDGLNRYCFVGNSPMRYADADGRMMDDTLDQFISNLKYNPGGDDQTVMELVVGLSGHVSENVIDPTAFLQTLTSNPADDGPRVRSLAEELSRSGQAASQTQALPAQFPGYVSASALPGTAYETGAEQAHDGNIRFSCQHCPKGFKRKHNFDMHMRTHTGEKPFNCLVCKKSFALKRHLTRHMLSHTGEKPYHCETCGKDFARNDALTSHRRTHTGEKPYICEFCHQGFAANGALTRHRRTHTGEKPYVCEFCHQGFAESTTLTRHRRTHTLEKPYDCSSCYMCFADSNSRNNHQRRKHGALE